MTTCTYLGLQYATTLRPKEKVLNYSPNLIIEIACRVLRKNKYDLTGKSRLRELVETRMIIMAVIHEKNPKIGLKRLGGLFHRHHSTVVYNLATHNTLMGTIEYRNRYERLISAL